MRPAESGKEVVQRQLVGQVDHGEAQAPLVAVAIEQVIVAHARVKQVARGDALGIVIIIFFPYSGDADQRGPEPTGRTGGQRGAGRTRGSRYTVARESSLEFLISRQRQAGNVVDQRDLSCRDRCSTTIGDRG